MAGYLNDNHMTQCRKPGYRQKLVYDQWQLCSLNGIWHKNYPKLPGAKEQIKSIGSQLRVGLSEL